MEQKKEDIFDRMMHLHLFRIFEPFYQKNKEMLLYLLVGWVNHHCQYRFLCLGQCGLGINELHCQHYFWIFAVTLAYVTTKSGYSSQKSPDFSMSAGK